MEEQDIVNYLSEIRRYGYRDRWIVKFNLSNVIRVISQRNISPTFKMYCCVAVLGDF